MNERIKNTGEVILYAIFLTEEALGPGKWTLAFEVRVRVSSLKSPFAFSQESVFEISTSSFDPGEMQENPSCTQNRRVALGIRLRLDPSIP